MRMHGGGWSSLLRDEPDRARAVTPALLRRVMGYARPYRWHIAALLGAILLTTVLGLIPVFLATGRGSDVMQPMAIPSVGGMAVGLVTLFVTPCVYCWVEERKVRSRTREEKTPARGHPLP